jgi:quercetin dioxygenase-like cupin family protein
MNIAHLPPGMIDWSAVTSTVLAGETGHASGRARQLGDIQLRVVEYSAGYLADHWCHKGHILYVLSGALVIEHRDGTRYELAPGSSWHVADNEGAPHRVVCAGGATVFIVD